MAIGTFATSALLLAHTGQMSSIGNAKTEARVAFDRLMNAFSLCDRNELARLSPEWTYVGLAGHLYTREDYLKDTRERCKPGPAPVLRDVQVRTYGDDTAIITAAVETPDTIKVAAGSVRVTVVGSSRTAAGRAFTLTLLESEQTKRTRVLADSEDSCTYFRLHIRRADPPTVTFSWRSG